MTFGEFETVGEPLARTEERGHVTTVWQARRTAGADNRLFAIKCYCPRWREPKPGQPEDTLDKDRGLQFLDGVKQLAKAQKEGAPGLTPIHAMGLSEAGAWYATDFYPRKNLKAWIGLRGTTNHAALQHIIHSVATGCLALKQSAGRGYSHGNLKPANIFLVGPPRPLSRTPLLLADAYPASPRQLARLDETDRHEVTELLHQVMEAQDLRAIGELILQLVERRLITRPEDYDYPVKSSRAWETLGSKAQQWLSRCNKLLDPQLSLEKLNLEQLAKDTRPSLAAAKLPVLLGGVAGVCVLAVAGYGVTSYIKKRSNEQRQAAARRESAFVGWTNQISAARGLLAQTNFSGAAAEFSSAGQKLGELNQDYYKATSEAGLALARSLEGAQTLLLRNQHDLVLEPLIQAAAHLEKFPDIPSRQWIGSQAVAEGLLAVTAANVSRATECANLAARVGTDGEAARTFQNKLTTLKNEIAAKPWADFSKQPSFQRALALWEQQQVSAPLQRIVKRGFSDNSSLDLARYSLPDFWSRLPAEDRSQQIAALNHIGDADGRERRDFAGWKADLERDYGPLTGDQLARGWDVALLQLTNLVKDVESSTSAAELSADIKRLHEMQTKAGEISTAAQGGGLARRSLTNRAAILLTEWRTVEPTLRSHIASSAASMERDRKLREITSTYPWFSADLLTQVGNEPGLARDLGAIVNNLPPYPAPGNNVPETLAGKLVEFKSALDGWWDTNALTTETINGLPAADVLQSLVQTERTGAGRPDYTSSRSLAQSVSKHFRSRATTQAAVEGLRAGWQTITNSEGFKVAANAWQTNVANGRELVDKLVRRDFASAVGNTCSNLTTFTNSITQASSNLVSKCATHFYAPPSLLGQLDPKERPRELQKLDRISGGGTLEDYQSWRNELDAQYGPINISALVTNWSEARLKETGAAFDKLRGNLNGCAQAYKPTPSLSELAAEYTNFTVTAETLQTDCGQGGKPRTALKQRAERLLGDRDKLASALDGALTKSTQFCSAQKSFSSCEYTQALVICRQEKFTDLQAKIETEQAQYDNLASNYNFGSFDAVLSRTNQFPNKSGFNTLVQKANQEHILLAQLQDKQKSDQWKDVSDTLTPRSDLLAKKCFKDLYDWSKTRDPARQIEPMIATLKVRLDIKGAEKVNDAWSSGPAQYDRDWQLKLASYKSRVNDVRQRIQKSGLKNPSWEKDLNSIESKLNQAR